MTDILQLRDFCMQRLLVNWHFPPPGEDEMITVASDLSIDYDVLRDLGGDPGLGLALQVSSIPANPKEPVGYEIDTEILGVFDFPEGMNDDQVQALVRVNGCAILYGILRGKIAAFTGSFPGGKYVLPTVSMPDVVREVESRKFLEEDGARNTKSPKRRAARKKPSSKKKATPRRRSSSKNS